MTVKAVPKQMNLVAEANKRINIELISSSMAKYSQISSEFFFFFESFYYSLTCEFTLTATRSYQRLKFHFILLEINGLNRLTLLWFLILFTLVARKIFHYIANIVQRTTSTVYTEPLSTKINNFFLIFSWCFHPVHSNLNTKMQNSIQVNWLKCVWEKNTVKNALIYK